MFFFTQEQSLNFFFLQEVERVCSLLRAVLSKKKDPRGQMKEQRRRSWKTWLLSWLREYFRSTRVRLFSFFMRFVSKLNHLFGNLTHGIMHSIGMLSAMIGNGQVKFVRLSVYLCCFFSKYDCQRKISLIIGVEKWIPSPPFFFPAPTISSVPFRFVLETLSYCHSFTRFYGLVI